MTVRTLDKSVQWNGWKFRRGNQGQRAARCRASKSRQLIAVNLEIPEDHSHPRTVPPYPGPLPEEREPYRQPECHIVAVFSSHYHCRTALCPPIAKRADFDSPS